MSNPKIRASYWFGLSVVIMFLVSRLIDLEVVLTTPLSEWGAADAPKEQVENAEDTELVSVLDVATAQESEPMRVAGGPQPSDSEGMLEAEVSSGPREEPDAVSVETPDSDTPEQLDDTEEASQENASDALATQTIEQILQTGGQLVEEGRKLPKLSVTFDLEDIEAIVRSGHGLFVFHVEGAFYRVVLGENSLLDASRFELMGRDELDSISNRGWALNRRRNEAFAGLETRFRRVVGSGSRDRPLVKFMPSASLDHYIASKQLGAMNQLGINGENGQRVVTCGRLVNGLGRPVFLIDLVRRGTEVVRWVDPESATE